MRRTHPYTEGIRGALFIVVVLLALVSLFIGETRFAEKYRHEAECRLKENVEARARWIARWREERMTDAVLIAKAFTLSPLTRRLLAHPADTHTHGLLRPNLVHYTQNRNLERISLFDLQGREVLTTADVPEELPGRFRETFQAVLAEGRPLFSDSIAIRPDGSLRFLILAPVEDPALTRIIGVYGCWIDPHRGLSPLLETSSLFGWPFTPLLVFREKEKALVLDFSKPDSVQRRQIPLDRKEMPVVRAAQGETGILTGPGISGREMVAAVSFIPGSAWALVIEVEKAVLETPLRTHGRLVFLLGFSLVIGAGFYLGMRYWRGQAKLAQEKGKTERALSALSARHEALLEAVPDIVAVVDHRKVYTWFNRAGLAFFGEDAIGREAVDYFVGEQDTYDRVAPLFEGVEETVYVESWQRRRDGQKRLLAWWCRPLKDGEGRTLGALSTARDITELRERQVRLETLNRLYAVLSEITRMIVRVQDPNTLFHETCRIAVDKGGYALVWIGLLGPDASAVIPVASSGREPGDFDRFHLLLDEGPMAQGPTACRTGEPVVVEDIATDPRTAPWREEALKRGYRASAAFPLTVFGRCKGVFSLYADSARYFGPEEIVLLQEVARDIAYAIEFLEKEKKRQEAEEALRRSETWFRRLADITSAGILIYQGERIVFANAAVTRISGYTMEDLETRPFWEFVHPEDRELVKSRGLARQRGEEVPSHYAFRILGKDGRTIWLDFTAGLIDWQGRPAGVATFYDITGLKEVETALKQKSEDLAFLVDIGTLLLQGEDLETLLQRVVEGGMLLFGLETGAIYLLEGETLRLVATTPSLPPDSPDDLRMVPVAAYPQVGEALRTRRPVILPDAAVADLSPSEREVVVRKGLRTLILLPLFKEDHALGVLIFGSVERVHILTEDEIDLGRIFATQVALAIEASRLLEETRHYAAELETHVCQLEATRAALAESEARFRRLAENAEDLIYRYEFVPKRGFTYVSPSATAMTGYTPEDHYADPDLGFKIVHPEDRPLLEAVAQAGIEKGRAIVLRWIKKDGSVIWTEQRNVPIYDEAGHLIAIEGIVRDITERKRAEEQIRRDLAEKEVLLREIHHRVKNNLTVIASLLNLQASRVKSSEEALAAFEESRDRVYAMALIHEKIYQHSGDFSEIHMHPYLEALARQLSRLYDPGGRIRLRVEIGEGKLDLNRAVPCALILNELVTNALKHAFPEGRKGEVVVSFGPFGEGRYALTVTDHGIGIPPGFDPGQNGTFGLYLVGLLTKQLNGEWSFQGGKGTSIRIVFPGK